LPKLPPHSDFIDQWLEQVSAQALTSAGLLDLLDAALAAIWARTSTTLGVVTLSAVADRVLHNAGESYPPFDAVKLESTGQIQARELRRTIDSLEHRKVLRAVRGVLVEFLTVLSNLTADILTRELQAELLALAGNRTTSVARSRPQRVGARGGRP